MTLPNFLIIGTARSGTTAFYEYLSQHPQVFMSDPKEPNFLALEGRTADFRGPGDDVSVNQQSVTRLEDYQRLFDAPAHARAIGEASIAYMYLAESIEGIRRHVPHARLLVMLRHPAERAYSAWGLQRSRMFESLEFEAALAAEPERIRANWQHIWHYRAMGFYGEQLSRYFAAFPREQLRVYLYDDFKRDRDAVLRDAYRFLGVAEDFTPHTSARPVMAGTPRYPALQRVLMTAWRHRGAIQRVLPKGLRSTIWRRLNQANLERTSLPARLRQQLTADYRDDILLLQDLLQRDLSGWLNA